MDRSKKIIPPLNVPPEQFPETDELPEGARTVAWADTIGGPVDLIPGIQYAVREGCPLHIELYRPALAEPAPLIVHVQGSAWMKQRMFQSVSLLIRLAEKGYAIASVEYRPSEVSPFPAQVEDVKTAMVFLAKRAAEYGLDMDRVAVWGDSSGGHTAALVGVTGARELFPAGEDAAAFPQIRAIVDWYGPTEIAEMNRYPSGMDHIAPTSPEGLLIGGKNVLENPELAERTTVMNYLSADVETPPMLIMHGGSDMLVPFNQSCRLYERLRALRKEASMIKLVGGRHGFAGFRSENALAAVDAFIREHLPG